MPDDLQIHVVTTADLGALKSTQSAVAQISDATRQLGGNAVPTEAALAKVTNALGKVDSSKLRESTEISNEFRQSLAKITAEVPGLQGAVSVFETLGGKMGAVAAAAGLIAGGLALAKKSLVEFGAEQEKVFALDATLATRGILSDDFRNRLQRLSQELQDTTKIDSGVFLESMQRLVSAGADSSNIDRLLEGVVNLAGATGRDIPEASLLMQRAMQGNFEMLRRVGLNFEKTGDQAKDMDRLLQLVAERGAGVLQAKGESLNGTVRGLGLAFADAMKSSGNWLDSTLHLTSAIATLTEWVKALGAGGPEVVAKMDGLKNKFVEAGKSAADAARDQESFEKSQKAVAAASDEAAAALERQVAAMDELNRFNKDLIDANLKVDLAKLDQRKQAGQIGGVDYETQRAQLIARAENAKFERDRQTSQDKIRAAQDDATQRKDEVTRLDQDIDERERRIKRAEELKDREAQLRKELGEQTELSARLGLERQYRQDIIDDKVTAGGVPIVYPQAKKDEAARMIVDYNRRISEANTRGGAASNELVNIRDERETTGIKSVADEQRELENLKTRLSDAEERLKQAEIKAGAVANKESVGIERQRQLLGRQREAEQIGVDTRVATERDKEREQRASEAIQNAQNAVESAKRRGISVDETQWVDKVIETLKDVGLTFADLNAKQLGDVEQRQTQLIDAKLAAAKAELKRDFEQKLKNRSGR